MENLSYLRRGTIYSLRYMLTVLKLPDSPHLMFVHNGVECVIQEAHTTNEQLLSIPEFGESNWTYHYTTDECIPIFKFARGQNDIEKFVDIVPTIDDYTGEVVPNSYWVVPKGFPREQWYTEKQRDYAAAQAEVDEETFSDTLETLEVGIARMNEEADKYEQSKQD